MIPVSNRQRRVKVTARDVRAVIAAVYAAEKAGEPSISVALVNDRVIRDVNREYLNHDWATDSIAFSYEDDPSPDAVTGEVVASAETALRVAEELGKDPRYELLLYVAHGTLHLLGWDDETPAMRRRMNARADRILCAAGFEEVSA
ncbi:MAG: rRNA maturation RNase YbeY [Planctomycetota bacterium]|nr:rRNA maturation RNase YbeY [Planctomycetota bacterium]